MMTDDIAPAAAALNEPHECPHCEGRGYGRTANWVSRKTSRCYVCHGRLTVRLSTQDKTRRALTARLCEVRPDREGRLYLTDAEMDAQRREDHALWGFAQVESLEPQRIDRMWESIERGRIDAVIDALVAYYHEHTTRDGWDAR